MDLSKLSMGDKLIAGGGILLLIFSFFKWLGVKYGPYSDSKGAWSFTLTLIAVLLGIAMVVYVVLVKVQGMQMSAPGAVTWAQIILIVATVAFVFILIKVIVGPSFDTGGFSGVEKTRKIGIFLGLIASGVQLAGAFLNAKEAGELPSWLGGSRGGTTGTTGTA